MNNIEQAESVLKGKKVLVTGATGFTGGHVARRLLAIGAQVTILARKTSNQDTVNELAEKGATIVFGDVTNRDSVFEAVKGQEYVFHIAALFREAKHPDSRYFEVNRDGVIHVFDAAEEFGIRRVIHCSTIGVHSHIPNPPASESEPYRPGDVYQESKCEGEKVALERMKKGKVEVSIIRPAMIWGDGDRRFVKLFKGVIRRRLPIIGSGKSLTHWIYFEDLVDAFLLAAVRPEANGQVYIIAGRTIVPYEEVVKAIAKVAGVKPLLWKVPVSLVWVAGFLTELICRPLGIEPPLYRRRVDFFTKSRAFNTAKAQKELGFSPRYNFEEEVRRIYVSYQQSGLL